MFLRWVLKCSRRYDAFKNQSYGKNRGKQGRKAKIEQFAPPHFGNFWAHFDHFPKLISCIPYVVSNLGKSGVHSFKQYSIWRWNEEVIAFEDEPRKAKTIFFFLFRSCAPISKGVSQLRNHPLEHECYFAAPYAHFSAAKWAAKIPLLCEIHPLLRKCSKLKKWAAKFPFCCQMISKLPNGCEMISKLQNGYENALNIKTGCEIPIWLRNDFAAP